MGGGDGVVEGLEAPGYGVDADCEVPFSVSVYTKKDLGWFAAQRKVAQE